jgi:NAD-dependent dihydropyrimidine dehydrogenase PreA subunit
MATSGPECRGEPGSFAPVVDRGRCEGKAECVEVCPFDVFEVRRIDDADFARLGVFAKLRSLAHGRKTAYTPRAPACEACGKCVAACPEKAITLARVASEGGEAVQGGGEAVEE